VFNLKLKLRSVLKAAEILHVRSIVTLLSRGPAIQTNIIVAYAIVGELSCLFDRSRGYLLYIK